MRLTARLILLALVLLLAACASGGPKRELPDPPDPFTGDVALERVWRVSLASEDAAGLGLMPAVYRDEVYLASADGLLSAVRLETGERLWRVDLDAELAGGPAVAGNIVTVGTRDGRVIGVDRRTGEVRWYSGVTSEVLAAPVSDGRVVVARSQDGRVFGLDAQTGRRLWLYERGVPALTVRGIGEPVLDERRAYVGLDNGDLVAIDLSDGKSAWEFDLGVQKGRTDLERMVDIDGAPVVFRDSVYAVSFQGRIGAVLAATGRAQWAREFSSHRALAVDVDHVYVVDSDNQVWALDRLSGASVWRQEKLIGAVLGSPSIYRPWVLLGDDEGYLNLLSIRDGELQARIRVAQGALRHRPVVVGKLLLVQSDAGDVTAYRLP